LLAYIDEAGYNEVELKNITGNNTYSLKTIPKQNWNAVWEENFQPVTVEDFCIIRADFHDLPITTPYEIIITPKMSFGTGHHATTQLMMIMMKDMDFAGKKVLDFGTGTGVLAILAEKLGAADILGIDNDEWSVENSEENVLRNNCKKITIELNKKDVLPEGTWDIILANINRHILLAYMKELYAKTMVGGIVLMSGLLVADKEIIVNAATTEGLKLFGYQELNGWITLSFYKN
jgi:ribosomal protein L11 methyltransferase